MSAIDVDPKTLEIGAAASAHAFEQAIVHIGEEIRARDPQKLDALVGSLAPVGPYAYTILPEVGADGSVKLPVLTTREEITGRLRVHPRPERPARGHRAHRDSRARGTCSRTT